MSNSLDPDETPARRLIQTQAVFKYVTYVVIDGLRVKECTYFYGKEINITLFSLHIFSKEILSRKPEQFWIKSEENILLFLLNIFYSTNIDIIYEQRSK